VVNHTANIHPPDSSHDRILHDLCFPEKVPDTIRPPDVRRHPRKGTSGSGLVAQGPLFGPAAFPAVRILAAPPTGSSQFPRTAPRNPRRGGKAARQESEP
jgi:hypothetical protein